jgi:hypothetical protein
MLGINPKARSQLESSTNFGYTGRHHEPLNQKTTEPNVYDPNVYKFLNNDNFSFAGSSSKNSTSTIKPPQIQISGQDSQIVTGQPPKPPKSKYQDLKERTMKMFNVNDKQKTMLDNSFVDNSSTSIGSSSNYYLSNGSGSLTTLNKVAKWSKNSTSLNSIQSASSFANSNALDHNNCEQQKTTTVTAADVIKANRVNSVQGITREKTGFHKASSIDEPTVFDSPSMNDLAFRSKNEPVPTVKPETSNSNYVSTSRMITSRTNVRETNESMKQKNNDHITRMFTKEPTNFSIKLSYDQLFKRSNTMTPHNYSDLDAMDPNLRLARGNTKKNIVS